MAQRSNAVDVERTRGPLLGEYRAVCGDVEPRAALDAHWPEHFGRPIDPLRDDATPDVHWHDGIAGCRHCAIALAALWFQGLGKPDPGLETHAKLAELRATIEHALKLTVELDPKSPWIPQFERAVADVAVAEASLPIRVRRRAAAEQKRAGRPSLNDLGCVEFILESGGYARKQIAELVVDEGGVNEARSGRTEKRIKRYRESLDRQNAETILSGESQEGTPVPSEE